MKNKETQTLENKLFKVILQATVVLSFLNVVGNYYSKLPSSLNIKWYMLSIVSMLMLWLMRYESLNIYAKLIYSLSIILGMLPCGWIQSGGSKNNPIAYTFVIMICISFFFQGKLRAALLSLLIAVCVGLYSMEYFFPQLMYVHSDESQFLDHLIQTPLTLTAGYILIKQFVDAYYHEKEMLREANEELNYLANHDSLTGMFNRRMFDQQFDTVFKNREYEQGDISIILLDIDHFKHFNDTYGHGFGDIIICELATIATHTMPEGTIISRWGGDEFAMIVKSSINEITDFANELYNEFKKLEFEEVKQATISMGITQIRKEDTKNQVFKRVDEALYQSKNKGKNQYTVL